MKKNGYVLLETIIVTAVLGGVLMTLYAGFSTIITNVKKENYYDNTDYLYRTNIVRNLIENHKVSLNTSHSGGSITVSCSRLKPSIANGNNNCNNAYLNDLNVYGIYITDYDPYGSIGNGNWYDLEATTQKYIKHLDPPSTSSRSRLIVMYKSEDAPSDPPVYEYASLLY